MDAATCADSENLAAGRILDACNMGSQIFRALSSCWEQLSCPLTGAGPAPVLRCMQRYMYRTLGYMHHWPEP